MPREYHRKPKPAPKDHPLFFAGATDTELMDGWELLLTPEEAKGYGYSTKRLRENQVKVDGIKRALGMNMTVTEVCSLFHVHHRVITKLAEEEKIDLDGLKNSTGQLMLKTSQVCARIVLGRALRDDISTKDASVAAGIFSQNGMLLTGSPTAILETRDRSSLTVDAVNGFWERIKKIKGATGDGMSEAAAPTVPTPGPEPAKGDLAAAPVDVPSTGNEGGNQ